MIVKLFHKNRLLIYLAKTYKTKEFNAKKKVCLEYINMHNNSRKFVDLLLRRLYQKLIINQKREVIMR